MDKVWLDFVILEATSHILVFGMENFKFISSYVTIYFLVLGTRFQDDTSWHSFDNFLFIYISTECGKSISMLF